MSAKDRVSDLAVEQLARGELAADEAARVRAALGDEADARVQALAADDADTLARLPPAMVATEVRRRLAQRQPEPRPRPASWWIPTAALVAAGLAVWWFVRVPVGGDDGVVSVTGGGVDELPETTRIKGDPQLSIDRVVAKGLEPLHDGDLVRAGDRLQLHYLAANRSQGAIVSIDGRGVATLHFPADVSASPVLDSGGSIALDHSYELDDAPSFERFFFVTVKSGRTLDVRRVVAAAEALARSEAAARGELALPADYEQRSLSLRKPMR